jgi:hypothetical protein
MEKVSNEKFVVEKFNGKNNFKLWKLKIRHVSVQQGMHKTLASKTKKPMGMIDKD